MQMLTKPQTATEVSHAVIGQNWGLLQPTDDMPAYDLTETRAALHQAEIVMRAQEERIRTLEALALTDELTGLNNRRGFGVAFERELSLARRDSGCAGILVMIDLDGFKEINDKAGHQAGDTYLRAVGQTLQETVRASDTVARLGGDEFALLLTRMDEKTGAKRLAKLEQAFCKRSVVLHEAVPFRASFGFAPYTGINTAEDVMHAADIRLYAHKARNKMLTVGA